MPKSFYLLCLLLVTTLYACHRKHLGPAALPAAGPRVLGYLHSSGDWQSVLPYASLDQVTDLNLAFFNPDPSGSFQVQPGLDSLLKAAHRAGVRVWMSIGGGSPPPHLKSLVKGDQRDTYIRNMVSFAVSNGFDGIDVDLENELIDEAYGPFVAELEKQARKKGLPLSAALASWNAGKISDATLQSYSHINIMSYDRTGPWNPSKPGQHSPFQMAEADFRYFNTSRKIPASRLLIGLPFYGYGFGGSAPQSIAYRQLILSYPGSQESDSIQLADGGRIYFNGLPTIREKTRFARQVQAAGVMIWELKQDSRDEHSLLKAIRETMR